MSRKQDPVLAVLRYFREAELPLAQQALAMAASVVRDRGPKRKNDTPTRKPPARNVTAPAAGSSAD